MLSTDLISFRQSLGRLKRRAFNLINEPALILLYHRVTTLPLDSHQLAVTPENFRQHVTFLKKHYNLISADELCEILSRGKRIPPRTTVITFDDGYVDNYLEAIPILESQKASALFYITTSKLNTHEKLWWDELENLLLGDEAIFFNVELTLSIKGVLHKFPVRTPEERVKSHHELHPLIKRNSVHQREILLSELRAQIINPLQENKLHRLLGYDELVKLSRSSSAIIGAHTVDHVVLSEETPEHQRNQITTSKLVLEDITKKKIKHFSYPFGTKADYNSTSVAICRETGFEMVCSNYHGQVHSWSNRFELPRVLVRDWPLDEFKKQLEASFKF